MAARRSLASVAEAIGRLAVVIVGAFVLAGLVGLNLNGMIAGLGITGLALALAAKDSVANIFGAISIIIDQPFNVGDWIIVEDVEGEVISIGLRTTMIRTGNDTIVTMPNSNITNSPVENFTMRRFRRIRHPSNLRRIATRGHSRSSAIRCARRFSRIPGPRRTRTLG